MSRNMSIVNKTPAEMKIYNNKDELIDFDENPDDLQDWHSVEEFSKQM